MVTPGIRVPRHTCFDFNGANSVEAGFLFPSHASPTPHNSSDHHHRVEFGSVSTADLERKDRVASTILAPLPTSDGPVWLARAVGIPSRTCGSMPSNFSASGPLVSHRAASSIPLCVWGGVRHPPPLILSPLILSLQVCLLHFPQDVPPHPQPRRQSATPTVQSRYTYVTTHEDMSCRHEAPSRHQSLVRPIRHGVSRISNELELGMDA